MAREYGIHQLKIDEEFRKLIPPLSKEERKQLEENICQDGCRDALVIWNKTIIDGHNRYEICLKHQIPFRITHIFLKSREEAIAWICANQLGRRNIAEETRRYLIGKRYEMEKICERKSGGKNQYTKVLMYQDDTIAKEDNTRERLAKEYNVGSATIVRYGTFADAIDKLAKTVPELAEKVNKGKLKITQENLLKISRLSPQKIKNMSEDLIQNPNATLNKIDAIPNSKNNIPNKVQLKRMQIGLVKDMPKHDPDAEVLSLVLTIPSWIGSINRACDSVKFNEISTTACEKLRQMLNELQKVAESMIVQTKEKN